MALGRKTGGRRKGSVNKVKEEMRKRVCAVLDAIDIQAELQSLTASEKVKLWTALLEYVAPKLERESLPSVDAPKLYHTIAGTYFQLVDMRLKQVTESQTLTFVSNDTLTAVTQIPLQPKPIEDSDTNADEA